MRKIENRERDRRAQPEREGIEGEKKGGRERVDKTESEGEGQ